MLRLLAAGLVLVVGVSCGGDDSGSDEPATVEEFCASFRSFYEQVAGEPEALGKVLKDAAEEVEDVGLPEGVPDDARAGYQLTLDAIAGLPDEATEEDVATLEQGYSEEELAQVRAFTDYLAETCPDLGPSPAA